MKNVISHRMRVGIGAASLIALASATAAAKNWSDWSAPVNVESLPGSSLTVNTAAVDGCASHSPDGLTIVFNSNRTGNQDLYMATRSSTAEGFGAPTPLPAPVNSSSNEACPTFAEGHRLYFSSDPDDPAYDIYVSRRGKDGWSPPVRLGPNINTAGVLEEAADFYEDDQGRRVMVFTRRPPAGLAGQGGKLYQSIEGGPPSLVQGGPHSSAGDNRASLTKDGLTIFWDSVRGGPAPDIYYATRSNTSEPFGQAIALSGISGPGFDARPFISKDGSFMTFSSGRVGNESPAPDIWMTTRDKITGKSDD